MSRLDLTGRTAIVTGASAGIGLAAARAIVAAGGNVVLTARRQEVADAAAAELRGVALGFAAGGIDESAALRCVEATMSRFGSIDILVNAADRNPSAGPVLDQDYLRFTKTFGVNVWGPILWTSLVTRAWMGEHGGVVINTASIGGPTSDLGLYHAAKAALIHVTEQLALELSPGVRVNAVAPGTVRTPPDQPQSAVAAADHAEPEDIGAAIAFLASDAAGRITGETFVIDGGQRLSDAASFRGGEFSHV
ncbi:MULTISPECIES: SDR family oxidoreductase [unclassified Nocardia]|uniref:SDR family oxidoreductase n=1 Tax=unclassified Nocardia TaxID=2637762 RepID=UPI0033AD032C